MWIFLLEENAFIHKDLVTLPDLPYKLFPKVVVNTNQFQREW